MDKLSPMMKQYLEIKERNKDCLLFFRLGDFYEMFFDDAKTASEELDLTLTGKDCGLSERAPMCGVPFHAAETYIARLVEKGYKVAICEQMEDPATAKGLVKRDIIRIITPGTVIEDTMLEEGKNNYLCAFVIKDGAAGICFTDVSTGETHLTDISGENIENRIINEINRFSPSEILVCDDLENRPVLKRFFETEECGALTKRDKQSFDLNFTEQFLLKAYSVISIENLGIPKNSLSETAFGAAVEYVLETGVNGNTVLNTVDYYTEARFMKLNPTVINSLELFETMRTKSKKGSLLWVLDKTKTAMGKRLLRSYIEHPLMNYAAIISRQNAVDELFGDTVLRGETREYLSGIRDIERTMAKIVYGTGSAKELRSICNTVKIFPFIKQVLSPVTSKFLKEIYEQIDLLEDIATLIDSAIVDEPPALVREGGMIREGYNSEIDELKYDVANSTTILAEIEAREKERTGIKTLKVKYNKVFGYYIEVSNSFLDKVPTDYIRKQTIVNGERFITDELKVLESRILGAKDRVTSLEYEIYEEIRKKTAAELHRFQTTAAAIARLDVMASLAEVAVNNGYVRPTVNTDGNTVIKAGRHPVVELLTDTPFVSNDTFLNSSDNRCMIITGPNMAGKSTYMRQVAIITVMAQMGSFVPAESANIAICDAVYTRIGASDDLASGQSTFMVEMSEVASIIKNATKNSLLVLDEIGRGTSTYDGMAIAKAVLEYVTNKRKLGAKVLFATHYHELTAIENEIDGIKNYNIAVRKHGDDIIFLRKIVRGGADDSYGIEVAKLSGIPDGVITRAKQILSDLESENPPLKLPVSEEPLQMSMESHNAEKILKELQAIDVNTLTPIESMQTLFDLVNKAKSI